MIHFENINKQKINYENLANIPWLDIANPKIPSIGVDLDYFRNGLGSYSITNHFIESSSYAAGTCQRLGQASVNLTLTMVEKIDFESLESLFIVLTKHPIAFYINNTLLHDRMYSCVGYDIVHHACTYPETHFTFM